MNMTIATWRTLGITLSLLTLVLVAGCSSTRDAINYRGVPQNVKEFEVDGLRVILRPSGPSNHVVVGKLFIRGGLTALDEGASPALQQLAMLVPPLSGPKNMERTEYRRLIDRMVTGIIPGAGRDFSTMTLRCVDENFDKSWDLFTGVIMNPKYEPIELENTKERLMIGLRNRTISPEAYADYLADSAFFYGHPYGRFAQEADVPPLQAPELEEYYRGLFVKSRLYLVVVGNVDSTDLHNKIAASLAKLPQGDYEDPEIPVPPNSKKSELIIRRPFGERDIPTNYIVARFSAPSRTDSLYYPMMRLNSFLSGTLFREIRIERNLSYAPDASTNFGLTSYGEITVSTALPDSAWRVAKGEGIDFFRGYIINEKFMQSGLNGWITSNYIQEQTNESQANEMGVAEFYTGSWTNAFRTVDAIRKVTGEQVNIAAQLYLRNFTIVIVGNPDDIDPEVYQPKRASKGDSGNKEETGS